MLHRFVPCALALCVPLASHASAADAAAILKAAADACRSNKNGRYHAVWELKDEHSPQRVEGDVAFMRWPAEVESPPPPPTKPNADGSMPAMPMVLPKLRTTFNADLRVDLADGRVLAFNHDAGAVLDPSAKTHQVMKAWDGGEDLLTRDTTVMLLATPLLQPESLEKLRSPNNHLAAGPRENFHGVECDVVTARMPKPDADTDISMTVRIGVEDHLPRQVVFEQITSGKQSTRHTTTISNLHVNVRMDPSQFALAAPEGFATETLKPEPPPEMLAVGATAPNFTLKNGEGKNVSLTELKGKVVLVDFWGTWCGPCKMAMPSIQKVHAKYKDKGVMVIGISCREKPTADPAKTMKELGCDYGLLLNGETIVKEWHVPGYPTLYVIDRDGKIAHSELGFDEELEAKLSEAIEALLKE